MCLSLSFVRTSDLDLESGMCLLVACGVVLYVLGWKVVLYKNEALALSANVNPLALEEATRIIELTLA